MTNGQLAEQLRRCAKSMEAGVALNHTNFWLLWEAADAIERLNGQTNHMDRMMTMLEGENALLKRDSADKRTAPERDQ